ncbi:MAG: hypothetical protein H5U29_03315 [Pusillimonas sp.]|nr:hypothetical protein [Pusillimonas sp.]
MPTRLYSEKQIRAAIEADRQARGEPLFWYRPIDDGMYEGPVHNNSVGGKMLRDEKPSEWKPLYDAPQPQQPIPTDDGLWDETLRDRDHYHDMADKLAEAIAEHFGADIGEHSSANCPWDMALEVIKSAPQPQQQASDPVAWWKIFEGKVSVVPADTFLHEDANAAWWRALVFQDSPQPQQIPDGYKVASIDPPANCRQRLAKEGKPYPRSSCFVCGQLSPRHRECDAMLEAAPEVKP